MVEFVLFLLVCATVWLIRKWTESRERIDSLEARLNRLEARAPGPVLGPRPAAEPMPTPAPPPLPIPQPVIARVAVPPPIPVAPAPPPPPLMAAPAAAVNWEKFLGVKLFAWVGGFVLFLAVVFFVKYSFDENLITPQMR